MRAEKVYVGRRSGWIDGSELFFFSYIDNRAPLKLTNTDVCLNQNFCLILNNFVHSSSSIYDIIFP